MGNVLCRHKNSGVSGGGGHNTTSSLRSPFDRIISRVQLCPSTLHHETSNGKRNCNRIGTRTEKQVINEEEQPITEEMNNEKKIQNVQASDWQEAKLEVPSNDRERVKSIFADLIDPKTPVPPPRRHRYKKSDELYENKEPVDEKPIIKTVVDKHICKIDEERFYKQHMKHHSTVSLPNINELQLSLAKNISDHEININESHDDIRINSNENKKIGRLENYMMRCRSFGSLLPNKLVDKLKFSRRINSETAESDDSWGGLEDWDLGVIEHYKPHDNSLPRPVTKNKIIDTLNIKPVPPVRKTDSLLKKFKSKDNIDKGGQKESNMEKDKNQKNDEINKTNEMLNKENKSNLKIVDTSRKIDTQNVNNKEITDEISFKPVICSEERKKDCFDNYKENTTCNTPPPTPADMDLPTIMSLTPPFSFPEQTNSINNDHSTLMNLITKIRAQEPKNMSTEQTLSPCSTNDEECTDDASLTPSLNEFQVTLSNILEDTTNGDKRKITIPPKSDDSTKQV